MGRLLALECGAGLACGLVSGVDCGPAPVVFHTVLGVWRCSDDQKRIQHVSESICESVATANYTTRMPLIALHLMQAATHQDVVSTVLYSLGFSHLADSLCANSKTQGGRQI